MKRIIYSIINIIFLICIILIYIPNINEVNCDIVKCIINKKEVWTIEYDIKSIIDNRLYNIYIIEECGGEMGNCIDKCFLLSNKKVCYYDDNNIYDSFHQDKTQIKNKNESIIYLIILYMIYIILDCILHCILVYY
jgi:hypothetical protein